MADELADSELPVFFSTSEQQSLYDHPFVLFAIVSALHLCTRVPDVCTSEAAHIC